MGGRCGASTGRSFGAADPVAGQTRRLLPTVGEDLGVPGTAEGKIVVDRDFIQNKEIAGLTLNFKAGKLISMSAKSGIEPFKALYDAAGPGKEDFGTIDFGINPNVQLKPSSKMGVWMPAGMLSFSIGNNAGAGGENKSPFSYGFFLPGSKVTVDGKMLVENGILKK